HVILEIPVVVKACHAVGGGQGVGFFVILVSQEVLHHKGNGRGGNQRNQGHGDVDPHIRIIKEQEGRDGIDESKTGSGQHTRHRIPHFECKTPRQQYQQEG